MLRYRLADGLPRCYLAAILPPCYYFAALLFCYWFVWRGAQDMARKM
ncbi:MAG: hypothetical protein QXT00_02385 [Ignisphaera sp.]